MLLDGVDSYYQRLIQQQVQITYPIGDREYGIPDFSINDPDGNTFCVWLGDDVELLL